MHPPSWDVYVYVYIFSRNPKKKTSTYNIRREHNMPLKNACAVRVTTEWMLLFRRYIITSLHRRARPRWDPPRRPERRFPSNLHRPSRVRHVVVYSRFATDILYCRRRRLHLLDGAESSMIICTLFSGRHPARVCVCICICIYYNNKITVGTGSVHVGGGNSDIFK